MDETNQRTYRSGFRRTALIFALGVIVGYFLTRRSGPDFGESKFDRIECGMTRSEIMQILRYYSGDYSPAHWICPDHFVSNGDPGGIEIKSIGISASELSDLERRDMDRYATEGIRFGQQVVTREVWSGPNHYISVAFDQKDHVIGASLGEVIPPRYPPGFFRQLRWWWLNL